MCAYSVCEICRIGPAIDANASRAALLHLLHTNWWQGQCQWYPSSSPSPVCSSLLSKVRRFQYIFLTLSSNFASYTSYRTTTRCDRTLPTCSAPSTRSLSNTTGARLLHRQSASVGRPNTRPERRLVTIPSPPLLLPNIPCTRCSSESRHISNHVGRCTQGMVWASPRPQIQRLSETGLFGCKHE